MSEKEKKDSVAEETKTESPPPEPEKEEPPQSYKRISFILSIVLIFAGIVTMLNSWEVISIKIYRQSNKIINAEFNRNQAEIISRSLSQLNMTTYTSYFINDQLRASLDEELIELEALRDEESEDFDPVRYTTLAIQFDDALTQADVATFYFPTQYLRPDGTYDEERNRAERFADVANNLEIDSAKIVDETRAMRERKLGFMDATRLLGLSIAILGFEKVFYWKRRLIRYPIILAGLTALTLGFLTYISLSPDPISILF